MRDSVKLASTIIFLVHAILIYALGKLAIDSGYNPTMVYLASAFLVTGSSLVLSLAYLQPEYVALTLWGLVLIWWTAVCRILESPESWSLAAMFFEERRYTRLAIEGGGWIFLILLAFLYVIKIRKPHHP